MSKFEVNYLKDAQSYKNKPLNLPYSKSALKFLILYEKNAHNWLKLVIITLLKTYWIAKQKEPTIALSKIFLRASVFRHLTAQVPLFH